MINFFKKRKNFKYSTDNILNLIENKIDSLSPKESLKFLFNLDKRIYELEGQESIRYGKGIHTKHKHTKYHDFFIKNIEPGSKVLDIGCGNGALTFDIARKIPDVEVIGVDKNRQSIDFAKKNYSRKNIKFICCDVLKGLPDEKFNIIVMSNFLEHIKKRLQFLKKIISIYKPKRLLIRVPMYERDWRVPLKDELGLDYRLDQTHQIEYTQEKFSSELKEAGLQIIKMEIKWGEIWAEAKVENVNPNQT